MTPPIQSIWIGRPFKRLERLCMKSFLDHGHDFHLYTYEPIDNIPDGVVVKDANEILPKEEIFYSRSRGKISSFANYFRWRLLEMKGGYYVDMDIICLKPFDFEDELVYGWERDDSVNNAVLHTPKGHYLSMIMRKACDDINCFQPIDTYRWAIKKMLRKAVFGKVKSRPYAAHTEPGGPYYFTRFLQYYELIDHAKPINHFYPVAHDKGHELFDPTLNVMEQLQDSYCVHFWNHALANEFKDGAGGDMAGKSAFDILCERHGV